MLVTRERCGAPAGSRAAIESSGGGRGEGSGGGEWSRGIARCLQSAITTPGTLQAGRWGGSAPGWLGGIPPSSLGARGEEEDADAPVGRLGWMGRLRTERQVRFFDFLF